MKFYVRVVHDVDGQLIVTQSDLIVGDMDDYFLVERKLEESFLTGFVSVDLEDGGMSLIPSRHIWSVDIIFVEDFIDEQDNQNDGESSKSSG